MKNKKMIIPGILLFLGLIAMVGVHVLFNVVKVPTVTEKDFPFSVTYELNGENKKLEGTYRCTFQPSSEDSAYPTDRYYDGVHVETGEEGTVRYVIEKKNDEELVMYIEFHPDYLLGNPMYDDYYEDAPFEPTLLVFDEEGYEYSDEETLSHFDVEIIDWELPEPIENEIVFSGIGRVSVDSIFPMLAAAYVTLILCMLLVKKDKDLTVKAIDRISVIFNFIIALAAAPFMAFIASFTQIYTSGNELIYQVYYCIPALTVLCTAWSLCLRRKGYSKQGFLVQFAGLILFVICTVIEPL